MTLPASYAVAPNAIVAAAVWFQHSLLGSVATAIAVIAVAAVGFSMLFGYVSVRRGATVVLGCFILFAAPTIANALKALALAEDSPEQPEAAISADPPVPQPAPSPAYYDPYAGPSVPNQ